MKNPKQTYNKEPWRSWAMATKVTLNRADYERARLCVNFAAGVANEKLEAAPPLIEGLVAMATLCAQNAILMKALHNIAVWGDGSEVTAKFDEPEAARIARAAIFEAGALDG